MNLSYNISRHIDDNLKRIETLRSDILLHPLSPRNEIRLKWDINIERIVWEISLGNLAVSKMEAVKALSSSLAPKKSLSKEDTDVLSQRNTFSYIRENWLANPQPVTLSVIKKIYDLGCRPAMGKMSGLTEYSEKRINSLLSYLQKGQDHPVIQAGLVQAEIINITPFDNGNSRVARLLSYLYLYKGGYDVREMINLVEYYKRDVIAYKKMLEMVKVRGNTTLFLEYFTYGIAQALEKTLDNIKNHDFQDNLRISFWKLNQRQHKIIEALENPEEKITNKEVQKSFGVSQITASRDLSHLTNLGLLLVHGKGRSVFYTRT